MMALPDRVIAGESRILRLQQRFSLNFSAKTQFGSERRLAARRIRRMGTASNAIPIKNRNAAFLSPGLGTSLADVRGYIASIEGYLWGHADPGLTARVNAVKNDAQFKNLMKSTNPFAQATLRPFMLKLDRIAYDIKKAAGNEYECAAVTANVPKSLDVSNDSMRGDFGTLIDMCTLRTESESATPIHTIVNLPPPKTTCRIDRESQSALPAPRFWTFRLQAGTKTYGGILLQSNVLFSLNAVRTAMRSSVASSAPAVAGFYVQLSAPPWLTAILTA
jgi:hypothetical protein